MSSEPPISQHEELPDPSEKSKYNTVRKNIFVRQPAPLPNATEILARYRKNFQFVNSKQREALKHYGEEDFRLPKHLYEHSLKRWNLGFAGPNTQRAPAADEVARRKIQELSETEGLSEEGKASIWLHETTNDGYVEQLREYAQGLTTVPVGAVNRLLATIEAMRYDSVAEEARLRNKMRLDREEMEKRLNDCEEKCRKNKVDARIAGAIDITAESFKQTLDSYQDASSHIDLPTYMGTWVSGQQETDGEAPSPSKIPLAQLVSGLRLLLDCRDGAEESFTTTINETDAAAAERRAIYGSLSKQASELEEESRIRFTAFLAHAAQNEVPYLREMETYHEEAKGHCRSMVTMAAVLKTMSEERESLRASMRQGKAGITGTDSHALPEEISKIKTEGALVPIAALRNEQEHNVRLQRYLSNANTRIKKLEKTCKKGSDLSAQDLHRSINVYRGLVAESLYAEVLDQSKLFMDQIKELQSIIPGFKSIKRYIEVLEPVADSPDASASARIGVQEALNHVSSVLAASSDGLTNIHNSLTNTAEDLRKDGSDQHSGLGARWRQADAIAEMEAKEEENSRLRLELDKLVKGKIPISDISGVQSVLNAGDLERKRAQNLRQQLADSREREDLLKREVDLCKKENRKLEVQVGHMDKHIEALDTPEYELVEELKKAGTKLWKMEQQAGKAEATIEHLNDTLIDFSRRILEYEVRELERNGPDSATAGQAQARDISQASLRDSKEIKALRVEVTALRSRLNEKELQLEFVEKTIEDNMKKSELAAENVRKTREKATKEEVERLKDLLSAGRAREIDLEKRLKGTKSTLDSTTNMMEHIKALKKGKLGSQSSVKMLQVQLGILEKTCEEKDRNLQEIMQHCDESAKMCEKFKQLSIAKSAECKRSEELNEDLMKETGSLRRQLTLLEAKQERPRQNTGWGPSLAPPKGYSKDDDEMLTTRDLKRFDLKSRLSQQLGKQSRKGPILSIQRINATIAAEEWTIELAEEDDGQETKGPSKGPMLWASLSADLWLRGVDFQHRRAAIVSQIRVRRFSEAKQLLDGLKEWYDGIEATSESSWQEHFDWMDTLGSMTFLMAYLTAQEAWGARQSGRENWREQARQAQCVLNDALADYQKEKEMRQAREDADPSVPGYDESADSRWLQLGVRASEVIAATQRDHATPECQCKYQVARCPRHESIEGSMGLRLHNIAEIKGARSAEVLLSKETSKDLVEFAFKPAEAAPPAEPPRTPAVTDIERDLIEMQAGGQVGETADMFFFEDGYGDDDDDDDDDDDEGDAYGV